LRSKSHAREEKLGAAALVKFSAARLAIALLPEKCRQIAATLLIAKTSCTSADAE
jgi:hypothetical protein